MTENVWAGLDDLAKKKPKVPQTAVVANDPFAGLEDLADKPVRTNGSSRAGGIGSDAVAAQQSGRYEGGVSGAVKVAQRGYYEGLSGLLGLPVDITAGLLSAAGIDMPDDPAGGQKSLMRALEFLGAPKIEAQGAAHEIIRRVSQEMGAASIPAYGIAAKAPGAIRSLAMQGTQALSAGTLAAISRKAAEFVGFGEGGQNTADIVGAVTGGVIPSVVGGLAKKGYGAARGLALGSSSSDVQTAASSRATQRLSHSVGDASGVPAALEAEQTIPGFKPTTAQISNEPGLLGLEMELSAKSPELTAELTRRRTANNQAVRMAFEEVAPPAVGPAETRRAVRERLSRVTKTIEDRVVGLQDSIQTASQSPAEVGESTAQLLDSGEQSWRNAMRTASDGIDPSRTARWSTSPVKAEVKKLRMERPKTESPADTPNDIYAAVVKLKKDSPFTELRALRSRVLFDIRAEAAKPAPNRNLLRKLNRIEDATQRALDGVDASVYPDVAERYNAFRSEFAHGARIWREGPIRRALQSTTADSASFGQMFHARQGAKEAAAQLRSAGGSETVGFVRDFALDQTTGLTEKQTRKWITKYSAALSQYPEVRGELLDIASKRGRLGTLAARQGIVDRVAQENVVKMLLDEDASGAVVRIMRSRNPVKEAARVKRLIGNDPDAKAALKHALWDEFMSRSESPNLDQVGSPFLKPVEAKSFMRKNRAVFHALGYTPSEVANVEKLLDGAEMISRSKPPAVIRHPEESAPPKAIIPINMLWSRLFAVSRGVVGHKFLLAEGGSRLFSRYISSMTDHQVNSLLKKAIVDPVFASELLRRVPAGRELQTIKSLQAHLIATGAINIRAMGQGYNE